MLFFCSSLTEQQISISHDKPNEAACASIGSDITSRTLRFFEPCHQSASRLPIKAARRGRFWYLGGRLIWRGGPWRTPHEKGNLGHPPFCVGRNATKSHATAHGLQLPKEIWDTHLFDSGVALYLA